MPAPEVIGSYALEAFVIGIRRSVFLILLGLPIAVFLTLWLWRQESGSGGADYDYRYFLLEATIILAAYYRTFNRWGTLQPHMSV